MICCELLGKALNAVDWVVAVCLYVTQSTMHKSNGNKFDCCN